MSTNVLRPVLRKVEGGGDGPIAPVAPEIMATAGMWFDETGMLSAGGIATGWTNKGTDGATNDLIAVLGASDPIYVLPTGAMVMQSDQSAEAETKIRSATAGLAGISGGDFTFELSGMFPVDPTGTKYIFDRTVSPNSSFELSIGNDKRWNFRWSYNGSSTVFPDSTVNMPYTLGERWWLRIITDVDDGLGNTVTDYQFSSDGENYVSYDIQVDVPAHPEGMFYSAAAPDSTILISDSLSRFATWEAIFYYFDIYDSSATKIVSVNVMDMTNHPAGWTSSTGEEYYLDGGEWAFCSNPTPYPMMGSPLGLVNNRVLRTNAAIIGYDEPVTIMACFCPCSTAIGNSLEVLGKMFGGNAFRQMGLALDSNLANYFFHDSTSNQTIAQPVDWVPRTMTQRINDVNNLMRIEGKGEYTGSASAQGFDGLSVFSVESGAFSVFKGWISEVIVWNGSITDEEVEQVQAYWNEKYATFT